MSTLAALSLARRVTGPARLAGLRDAAEAIAEGLRASPVRSARVVTIDRVLVETRMALPDARLVSPFAVLVRRALALVAGDGTRVLVDPSDAGTGTPYEERISSRHPVLARVFTRSESEPWGAADVVASTALALRTIDRARAELGPVRWVAMRAELEAARAPSPRDAARYPRSLPAIDAVDDAVELAEGVVLLPTPGPTPGHASLAFCFAGRIHVFTHAGVAVDAWSPYESKIPGLREAVRLRNVEAIVRGDASDPSTALEAMAIERALADHDERAPAFFHVVPAMALASTFVAPRLRPLSLPPFS